MVIAQTPARKGYAMIARRLRRRAARTEEDIPPDDPATISRTARR